MHRFADDPAITDPSRQAGPDPLPHGDDGARTPAGNQLGLPLDRASWRTGRGRAGRVAVSPQ